MGICVPSLFYALDEEYREKRKILHDVWLVHDAV